MAVHSKSMMKNQHSFNTLSPVSSPPTDNAPQSPDPAFRISETEEGLKSTVKSLRKLVGGFCDPRNNDVYSSEDEDHDLYLTENHRPIDSRTARSLIQEGIHSPGIHSPEAEAVPRNPASAMASTRKVLFASDSLASSSGHKVALNEPKPEPVALVTSTEPAFRQRRDSSDGEDAEEYQSPKPIEVEATLQKNSESTENEDVGLPREPQRQFPRVVFFVTALVVGIALAVMVHLVDVADLSEQYAQVVSLPPKARPSGQEENAFKEIASSLGLDKDVIRKTELYLRETVGEVLETLEHRKNQVLEHGEHFYDDANDIFRKTYHTIEEYLQPNVSNDPEPKGEPLDVLETSDDEGEDLNSDNTIVESEEEPEEHVQEGESPPDSDVFSEESDEILKSKRGSSAIDKESSISNEDTTEGYVNCEENAVAADDEKISEDDDVDSETMNDEPLTEQDLPVIDEADTAKGSNSIDIETNEIQSMIDEPELQDPDAMEDDTEVVETGTETVGEIPSDEETTTNAESEEMDEGDTSVPAGEEDMVPAIRDGEEDMIPSQLVDDPPKIINEETGADSIDIKANEFQSITSMIDEPELQDPDAIEDDNEVVETGTETVGEIPSDQATTTNAESEEMDEGDTSVPAGEEDMVPAIRDGEEDMIPSQLVDDPPKIINEETLPDPEEEEEYSVKEDVEIVNEDSTVKGVAIGEQDISTPDEKEGAVAEEESEIIDEIFEKEIPIDQDDTSIQDGDEEGETIASDEEGAIKEEGMQESNRETLDELHENEPLSVNSDASNASDIEISAIEENQSDETKDAENTLEDTPLEGNDSNEQDTENGADDDIPLETPDTSPVQDPEDSTSLNEATMADDEEETVVEEQEEGTNKITWEDEEIMTSSKDERPSTHQSSPPPLDDISAMKESIKAIVGKYRSTTSDIPDPPTNQPVEDIVRKIEAIVTNGELPKRNNSNVSKETGHADPSKLAPRKHWITTPGWMSRKQQVSVE